MILLVAGILLLAPAGVVHALTECVPTVPEPASLLLVGAGIAALLGFRKAGK